MLEELKSFVNIQSVSRGFSNKTVLLSDSESNGKFLFHHFLSEALREGTKILLVSFNESFVYYNTISSKLGVNLSTCRAASQLVFVDAFTRLHDSGAPRAESDNHVYFSLKQQEVEVDPLCTLFHLIRGASDRGGHFALFIDDISVLLNVGLSVQEVDNFISYCQQYIAQNQGFVVVMTHADTEQECLLEKYLLYHSHFHIHTSRLETGVSRDVHGVIKFSKSAAQSCDRSSSQKIAHYKLNERNISIFSKGSV